MNNMSVMSQGSAHDNNNYYQPATDNQMMNNMQNMQNMSNMNNMPNMNNQMMDNMPRVGCRDNMGGNRGNWNNANNNQMMARTNRNDGMLHFNTMSSVMSSNPNSQSTMSGVTAGSPSGTISLQPESLTNSDFLPAYLKQFIGKWIRADFLIGNSIEQRVGILEDVGASYIILNAIEPATLVVCDLFAIKFVTIILDDSEYPKLLLV